MDAKTYCKLCDDRHATGQHDTRDVKPRPWIKDFLSGKSASVPVAATKPRTVSVAKPRTAKKTAHKTCECGTAIAKPERGPMPKFCSNKCRMRASRKVAV